MNKTVLTIALLFTCGFGFSQGIGEAKEEINPGEFKYSEVYGSTGEIAFAGDIKDGSLTFGVFSTGGKRFESVQKLTMVNSKNKRVTIIEAFAGRQGLIIIGELKTKYGIEQYVGRVDDGESNLVQGVYFNSVNISSKAPIHQLKYHYSNVSERIGITYFTEDSKTKETILNVRMANLSGEVELNSSQAFYRLLEKDISDVELEVFMGRFNGMSVGYHELRDNSDPKSIQSSVALFISGEKNNFSQVMMDGESVLHSLNISQGLENSIVVSGFVGVEDGRYMNVYAASYDVEELEKIGESMVPFETIELYSNEWFSEEKNYEPVIWDDFKIQCTQVSESGLTLVYANRSKVSVNKENEMIEINMDQLFLRLNGDGGLEQSYLMPYRQFVEENEKDEVQNLEKTLRADYSEVIFANRENVTVLYKRPNFDKRMDLKKGENFFPLFLTFNVNDGVFEDMKPPYRKEMSPESMYLNYYIMYNEKVGR